MGSKRIYRVSGDWMIWRCAFISMKGFLAAENEQYRSFMPVLIIKKWVREQNRSRSIFMMYCMDEQSTGKNEEEFHRAVAVVLYAEL